MTSGCYFLGTSLHRRNLLCGCYFEVGDSQHHCYILLFGFLFPGQRSRYHKDPGEDLYRYGAVSGVQPHKLQNSESSCSTERSHHSSPELKNNINKWSFLFFSFLNAFRSLYSISFQLSRQARHQFQFSKVASGNKRDK